MNFFVSVFSVFFLFSQFCAQTLTPKYEFNSIDEISGFHLGDVSISGNRVAIGSASPFIEGAVYIFEFNGLAWVQTAKIQASDNEVANGFGRSLDLEGDRLVVGAISSSLDDLANPPGAYVYDFNGTEWVETIKLAPTGYNLDAGFGCSVSLSGNRVAVGSSHNGGSFLSVGAVFVFEFNGSNWMQTQRITPNDSAISDAFGYRVSIDGDRIGVTAVGDGFTEDDGAAYIFDYDGNNWIESIKLLPSVFGPQFGYSLDLDGDQMIVGSHTGVTAMGNACIYEKNGSNWESTILYNFGGSMGDHFGYDVAIEGNKASVVAPWSFYDSEQSTLPLGVVHLYTKNGTWQKTAKLSKTLWDLENTGYAVALDGEILLTCSDKIYDPQSSVTGNIYDVSGTIGEIYNDLSQNCVKSATEPGLSHRRAIIEPGNIVVETNRFGTWQASLTNLGDYSIRADTTGDWSLTCPPVQNFSILDSNILTLSPSIGFVSDYPCASPDISVAMPFMRPCFTHQPICVQVCNLFTATGAYTNAYVELQLDSLISIDSTSTPLIALGNNLYRYDIDTTINPGQCEYIVFYATLSCDAVLNQTLCIKANVFPVESCLYDTIIVDPVIPTGVSPCTTPWNRSSLIVDGYCENDSIYFSITNQGPPGIGDMSCYTPVRVYIDGLIFLFDSIQLTGGQTIIYTFQGTGQTWRLETDQHPMHPGNSHPNATVELCGDAQNWTPGLVTILPQDDLDPIIDIYCGIVSSSYDPNDKRGFPLGITSFNYIKPNQDIEYMVRFQNTGTDTAFNIVVMDTLTLDLDIFSVIPGVASNPYTFTIHDSRVLEWKFNNILLPDSNVNEVASHGFLTFKVKQVKDLPNGTQIKNDADIYFDYNSPIITNESIHTVNTCLENPEFKVIHEMVCDNYIAPDNQTHDTSGIYKAVLQTTNGCDSIIFINLRVAETSFDTINKIVCDSYTSTVGNSYFSSGIYYEKNPVGIGCGDTSFVTINLLVNNTPEVEITSISEICNTANPFLLTQGSPQGGYYSINGALTNVFFPGIALLGTNNVVYNYIENGCKGSDSTLVIVQNCANFSEKEKDVTIFPNPTTGKIIFSGLEIKDLIEFVVFDELGRQVDKGLLKQELDLSFLAKGNYVLAIYTKQFVSRHLVQIIK